MVLIGGVKYACERCIRGHRVTTCNHTDQPLIMIKPKGRPSSQCKHCKNLRVAKNVHSSGACTCAKPNGPTSNAVKKKKCGCESGKNCECHKKKQTTNRNNSISSVHSETSRLVPSSESPTSGSDSSARVKRVGEVSIPINEYIPNRSNEIGNVLNEKAVSGFFQDVPLPFEPGHGLLDLFEKSSHSSSHLTSNHYNTFPITTPATTTNAPYVQNKNAPNVNDFDVFQNLVFASNTNSSTPNTDQNSRQTLFSSNGGLTNHNKTSSTSDDVSEHSVSSYHSGHTVHSNTTQNNSLINGSNNYNYNNNHNQQNNNKQSSGLFGNYQGYQNKGSNDDKAEVISLTASFHDIPDYEAYNSLNDQNLHNNSNHNHNVKPNAHTRISDNETTNHLLHVNGNGDHTNGASTKNSELLKSLNLN